MKVTKGLVFRLIFWMLAVFMVCVQIAALATEGFTRETLVVVSELLILMWFVLVYLLRKPLRAIVANLPWRWLRFVFLGVLSTTVAETAYIFSKPLHDNLAADIFLTLPWYFLWMLSWHMILSKYEFTLGEAFYLAGLHGFIIEGVLHGILANPALAILSLPLFTAIYGFIFIVPYAVLKDDYLGGAKIKLKKKFIYSLAPLLAYIPGAIWIIFWVLALKIKLAG